MPCNNCGQDSNGRRLCRDCDLAEQYTTAEVGQPVEDNTQE